MVEDLGTLGNAVVGEGVIEGEALTKNCHHQLLAGSPGYDDGDPELFDRLDGSRSDIGQSGGPWAAALQPRDLSIGGVCFTGRRANSKPLRAGRKITFRVTLANVGNKRVGHFPVEFWVDGQLRKVVRAAGLASCESDRVKFDYVTELGEHVFMFVVDPEGETGDADFTNNVVEWSFRVTSGGRSNRGQDGEMELQTAYPPRDMTGAYQYHLD